MYNSVVATHTNRENRPTLLDQYQTRVSGDVRRPATPSVPPETATCADCNAGGQMVTAEKAATICQCSRRLIYRWIEEGSLHFRELPDGAVLVCGVTLAAKLEQLEDATGYLAR